MKQPDGFDFFNLIDATGQADTTREQEVIAAIGRACPVASSRAGLPLPTLGLCRDLGLTSTPSAGGNLEMSSTATAPLRQLAGAARPLTVLDRAGIAVVNVNDAAATSLPRWAGDGGQWLVEGEPLLGANGLELSSVSSRAYAAAAAVSYSRRLRLSSAGDLQSAVVAELQRQVLQTVEAGLINGTGRSGQPLGLLQQAAGVAPFSGPPTWAELVGMAEALADADGDLSNAVWATHPSTGMAMAAIERSAESGRYLAEGIAGGWNIAGMPLVMSTAIPEGDVVLLDRRAVTVVYYGPPMLITSPFSGSNSILGLTTIVVNNYCDIVVTEPDLVIIGG